jgi:hypothetical protein
MTATKRVEKLEGALSGALKAGDRQADKLARLSRISARQRNVMWRALNLIQRGKYDDAALVMETDLCRDRKTEPGA